MRWERDEVRRRLVHSMDHPVLVLRGTGREQHVAALGPFSMEHDHDLGRAPLLRLVGPVVPDPDEPRTVLTLRDDPLEVLVGKGVVLHVDREVVDLRVDRQSLRERPRDEDAVALQAEVPVQRTRVVLLDDEDGLGCRLAVAGVHRLGRAPCVALRPVRREASPRLRAGHRASRRLQRGAIVRRPGPLDEPIGSAGARSPARPPRRPPAARRSRRSRWCRSGRSRRCPR